MDDLISRQEAIEAIQSLYPDMPIIDVFGSRNRWREKNKQYIECEFVIGILPSAKRNKGKWIKKMRIIETDKYASYNPEWYCSCCGGGYEPYIAELISFCPNCGADMREKEKKGEKR